jgi:hypothetical protein
MPKYGGLLSVTDARTSGRAVLAEPHNAIKVSTACPSSLGYSRMPPEMSFRFSNNPAYWRDRAAEACTSTADAEAKAILLRLANDFVRLADRAEARLKQEILSTTQGMPPTR